MKKALIRLEDVGPGGSYESKENQEKLVVIADYLQAQHVPFQVAVIPRFIDPSHGIDRSIADADPCSRSFVQMLEQLTRRGASLGMHGYTHQYGKEVSGDGFEFADPECSGESCAPDDPPEALIKREHFLHSYAYGRFEKASRQFHAAGLKPEWFETPHYTASPVQHHILAACSGIIYENPPSDPGSRTVSLLPSDSPLSCGALYVPTPLYYIGGASIEEDVKRMEREVGTYGDRELASFFYHPYLEFSYIHLQKNGPPVYEEHSPLQRLIRAFHGEGRQFVSLHSLFTLIPDFRQADLFRGDGCRLFRFKSGQREKDQLLIRKLSSESWYIADVRLDGPFKIGNGVQSLRPVLAHWPGFAGGTELIGDFNGDGRDDLAVWHGGSGRCSVALRTGDGLSPDGNWLWAGSFFEGWQALAGDINGDGRTDLLLWDPASGQLAVSYCSGARFAPPVPRSEPFRLGKSRIPRIGDLNGDGRDDLILWDQDLRVFEAWLNDGQQFHYTGVWLTVPAAHTFQETIPADFTGNGRDDLLLADRINGQWTVAYNTGSGFLLQEDAFGPWAAGVNTEVTAGDFTGTGRASLLAWMPDRYGGTLDAAVNALDLADRHGV